MALKNRNDQYGLVAIGLHWLSAIVVVGLFAVGLYMMELDYYDPLYRSLPHWHKSIGILLFATLLFRVIWRATNPRPSPMGSPAARLAASVLHRLFYLLLILIPISGYLISTADGRAIDVFNWFSVPASITSIENQEDIAGDIHELLAWGLIVLAALHAGAALKHHWIDKDNTLKRMLTANFSATLNQKPNPPSNGESQ